MARVAALALALCLHGVFVVVAWYAMQPPAPKPAAQAPAEVLQVRLITRSASTTPPAPPPPELPPPPPRATARPRAPVPPAKNAMTLQLPSPPPATKAHLYDANGQPLLPASAASAPTPGYVQRKPQGDTQIMRHDSPVTYRATRFEQYFPPPGETAGGAAVRKVVEKVIGSKDVDLPRGVHLKCMTVLGIPIPNCKNPPAPPSAKSGDARLSMAPARSLDGDAHAPPKPSEADCIAMYRAGKTLVWGCPVDTPNRSVDAELRERAGRNQPAH